HAAPAELHPPGGSRFPGVSTDADRALPLRLCGLPSPHPGLMLCGLASCDCHGGLAIEPLAGRRSHHPLLARATEDHRRTTRPTLTADQQTVASARLSSAGDLKRIAGLSIKAWSITSANFGGMEPSRWRMGVALVCRTTCQGSLPFGKSRGKQPVSMK